MNAEELAAQFDAGAQDAMDRRDRLSGDQVDHRSSLKGAALTWSKAAGLIRQHLCTPLQAAAPDMLAALEAIASCQSIAPGDCPDIAQKAVARAKGTPNV